MVIDRFLSARLRDDQAVYRGIGQRLDAFIAAEGREADARRLRQRLRRTADHMFKFLDYPAIPFKNPGAPGPNA